MTHQCRCETCKNLNCQRHGIHNLYPRECDLVTEASGCASHSDFQSKRNIVWVVAESRFEWYEIRHICSSKEIALQRWAELRDELIQGYQDMVEHCIKEGYHDADSWQKNIDALKNMKPGESCACDYPDLKEWNVGLDQIEGTGEQR